MHVMPITRQIGSATVLTIPVRSDHVRKHCVEAPRIEGCRRLHIEVGGPTLPELPANREFGPLEGLEEALGGGVITCAKPNFRHRTVGQASNVSVWLFKQSPLFVRRGRFLRTMFTYRRISCRSPSSREKNCSEPAGCRCRHPRRSPPPQMNPNGGGRCHNTQS